MTGAVEAARELGRMHARALGDPLDFYLLRAGCPASWRLAVNMAYEEGGQL